MNRVPFVGFADEPAELKQALAEAARDVINANTYVLGPRVAEFEEQWAGRCGTNECVGVANGLDAIEIILRTLGIGPGDEVITTPMTAVATVLAIMRAGATPVLADIDPSTALMDPASVERCLSPRTRAIVLVHLYGYVHSMDQWQQLCDEHEIALIEDCSQAHLARQNGVPAGAFGVAGAYSFYPTKNLGAIGDAGAIVTNDGVLAKQARSLRNYGQSNRYEHPMIGLNSRLDEMQAALLSVRLGNLDAYTERRQAVARAYRQGIRNPNIMLLAPPAEPEQHVYHLFVVQTADRAAFMAYLDANAIDSLIHYPIPAHEQVSLTHLARDPNGLVHAETHARTCVSLPCHPQLTDADVERVISVVNAYTPA